MITKCMQYECIIHDFVVGNGTLCWQELGRVVAL